MPEDSFRIEKDSMGEMRVPSDALYGAQTQRAVENFPISNLRFPREFIRAMGLIKLASARANMAARYPNTVPLLNSEHTFALSFGSLGRSGAAC